MLTRPSVPQRPHVLWIVNQHHIADGASAVCRTQQEAVSATLRLSTLDLAVIYPDTGRLVHQNRVYASAGDRTLIAYCQQRRPHMVLVDLAPSFTTNPSSLALAYVAWKLDIPVVGVVSGPDVEMCQWMDEQYPMCQHVMMVDGVCPVYHTADHRRYSWDWWPIVDHETQTSIERDAPQVVFSDPIQDGSPSAGLKAALVRRDARIRLSAAGSICEQCGSTDVERASVVIGPRCWHSRVVVEVCSAGALLVDTPESETWRMLAPGREYLELDDVETMADCIVQYLRRGAEMLAIAEAGRVRVRSVYTAQHWWRKLFFQVFGLVSC